MDSVTKAGTAGGTLLTIAVNVNSADVLKTGILAAIGAVVSYVVTMGVKAVVKWVRR